MYSQLNEANHSKYRTFAPESEGQALLDRDLSSEILPQRLFLPGHYHFLRIKLKVMNDISMHTHVPHEAADNLATTSNEELQLNGNSEGKASQRRTRFGIADLWKIQRNQRSAMAQRRGLL